MTSATHEHEEPGILGHIVRAGIINVATGALAQNVAAPMIDGQIPDAPGADVTAANHDLDGAELHAGPAGGQEFLDRPVAGFLAEQTTDNGLDLSYGAEDVHNIAAGFNDASTITVNGETIQLLNYAPGGDLIQAAAGQELSLTESLGMMAHVAAAQRSMASGNGLGSAGPIGSQAFDAYGDGGPGSRDDGSGYEHFALTGNSPGREGEGASTSESEKEKAERPDSPERQQLQREHALALSAALQTSDESDVESTVAIGDKSLTLKTHFEARSPDPQEEQQKGVEHIQEVMRSPRTDIQTAQNHIRMRSIIESQDEGMSIGH